MIDFLRWELSAHDNPARYYYQLFTLVLVMLPYIYLVIVDFKHREMEYWKLLAAGLVNVVVVSIPMIIWGSKKDGAIVISLFVLMFVLTVLNGLINSESTIGKADVDVFIFQAVLTGFAVSKVDFSDSVVGIIGSTMILEVVLTCIVLGLVLTILAWILEIKIVKKKKGNIFKLLRENTHAATLVAFLPWVFINSYILLSF